MKKRWFVVLFRSRLFIALALLAQIGFAVFLLASTSIHIKYASLALSVLSLCVCVHVFNRHTKGGYKLIWIFIIMLFPIFGGILYIFFHAQLTSRKFRRLLDKNEKDSREAFYLCGDRLPDLIQSYPKFKPQAHYLQEFAGFPVCANTRSLYFDSGESFHSRVLEELEKAQKYIFLEFFIIKKGVMVDAILEILERKAAQGLDVRVMYDDLGCFMSLPSGFKESMKKKGVKCYVFNPFRPMLSSLQNNRDHRKIISIDGKVAFTGGVNLADEYINAVERFGHWKDAAIMLEGEGAWSLTLIFLQMWNLSEAPPYKNTVLTGDSYTQFYPWGESSCELGAEEFVQPYADSPVNEDNVGEHVYLQIINNAKHYVYITTPYLIPDDSLISALILAAKSGVDVRIVTPYRWDKWYAAVISRSYYRQLIAAGVKVYEYTSGFNHGKTFVADDCVATVGTTNLDYRSLYLHFECGVMVYCRDGACGGTVQAVKDDFLRTVPVSREITLKDCAPNFFYRLLSDVLRIFAPLM